ncbi:MAG TPA: sugar ABC transporter substrate-binding protein [Chloroflexota bacterium]|jgi:multiple sugar transport system substrate-binding protein|nr:sugar ABC transporter substrate-binding protein [Chloroflexota bacterium]
MTETRPPSPITRRLVLGAAATPLALAACAAPGASAPPSTSIQPATLNVLSHSAGEEPAFKAMFEQFKTKRPEITVHFSVGTTGGANAAYNEKLVSLVAAGDAPDVFKTAPFGFGQLAHNGAYLALDDYVKKQAAEVKPDDFFPSHYEGSKYKGKLYALPQTGAPQAIWINLDLWQREGQPVPGWDTTWADYLRAATAITKRDAGGPALQLGTGRPDWLSWIWSNGGDLYTADGTKMLIDQPAAIEALTWLQEAVHRHRVAPTNQEQADMPLSAFENGRIGTVFGNRGGLGRYQSINGFTYDAAPLPKGPKGRLAQTAVGHTSIWSGSKSKDAAFATLVFMCSTEGQKILIGDGGTAHPSRRSSTEQSWFKDFKPPRAASTRVNTTFPETLIRKEARAITPHPREAEINQTIQRHLGDLWSNAKPPRDVAAAIMAETSAMMVK